MDYGLGGVIAFCITFFIFIGTTGGIIVCTVLPRSVLLDCWDLGTLKNIVIIWGILELFFLLFCKAITPGIQKLSNPPNYPTKQKELLMRILNRLESIYGDKKGQGLKAKEEIEKFISGWCLNAEFDTIYYENAAEFLGWAGYAKLLRDLTIKERKELDEVMTYIKNKHGIIFPLGHNPNVKAARLTLEDVWWLHRPLALYAGVKILECLTVTILAMKGYHRKYTTKDENHVYWYRPAANGFDEADNHDDTNPMIFFHGIAPNGLLFYLPMIFHISTNRACLLFENPSGK